MNTCGFCSTTYLGSKDLNFSCKIYHTKVYTTFTKVVVLFTRELEKFVSHFSNFSLNFYRIYKITGQAHKKDRIYFHAGPWKDLNLHNSTLRHKIPHNPVPGGGGELAAGDVGPGQANKWHHCAIGLTRTRSVGLARPEASSASGGGGVVAAHLRVPEIR
jgi:hypothetical protein